MAANFTLALDTTAPAGVGITLAGGDASCASQVIEAAIACTDGDKTGYQMKIWGDVDESYDADVQADEGDSAWISYAATKNIKLSSGDESKTIYAKVRDDVYNASSQQSDSITLDTSIPVVTISSGPDVTKVSKVEGKDDCTFQFTVDTGFEEYKVKVVAASGSTHDTGTTILTTNGSSNMSGNAGSYPASTPITCVVNGADLEVASGGDGDKIVKVFVKDDAGNWSA